MLLSIIGTLLGLAMILFGSNILVDGGAALARKMKISGQLIGVTLIAVATSLPELSTSVTASITGKDGLAIGNVVGSNAFNIGVVLALGILITTTRSNKITLRDGWMVILSVIVFGIFTIGGIGRIKSSILLLLYLSYILYIIITNKHETRVTEVKIKKGYPTLILLIIIGTMFLIIGSPILVSSSSILAGEIGVRDSFIGLTLIAAGTSLPELMTSVIAAVKKETGMAVGNVFGSNIFNILFIVGISGLIHPIFLTGMMNNGVIPGMMILTLLGIMLSRKRMGDFQSILLFLGYILFLLLIIPNRVWNGLF